MLFHSPVEISGNEDRYFFRSNGKRSSLEEIPENPVTSVAESFPKFKAKFFDRVESADGVFRLTWSKGSVYLRKFT